jgi:hypothetical protein
MIFCREAINNQFQLEEDYAFSDRCQDALKRSAHGNYGWHPSSPHGMF